MTANQINYAKLQEDIRTHMANEEVARRQASASETQAYAATVSANAAAANSRTNAILADLQRQQTEINRRAQEANQRYQEWQYAVSQNTLLETNRHNTAVEAENYRHNTASELLTSASQKNDYSIAEMQTKQKQAQAGLETFTTITSNMQNNSNRTTNTIISTLGNWGNSIIHGITDVAVEITRGANRALLKEEG